MALPDKIVINRDEIKVLIAVMLLFGLFWFVPRFINLVDGKGFFVPEKPAQPIDIDYNPTEEVPKW